MAGVEEAARALIEAFARGDRDAIPGRWQDVVGAARTDADGRDAALALLAGAIGALPTEEAAPLAMLAGAIVENGGSPDVAADAVVERLLGVLPEATAFAEAGDPAEQIAGEPQSDGAVAWWAVEVLGRPAVAMITRSAALRARYRPRMDELVACPHPFATWLWRALQVLDDEPVVVRIAGEDRGLRVRVGGVASGLQLGVLVSAALAEAFGTEAPDVEAVRVARGLGPPHGPGEVRLAWVFAGAGGEPLGPHDLPGRLPVVDGARVLVAEAASAGPEENLRLFEALDAWLVVDEVL